MAFNPDPFIRSFSCIGLHLRCFGGFVGYLSPPQTVTMVVLIHHERHSCRDRVFPPLSPVSIPSVGSFALPISVVGIGGNGCFSLSTHRSRLIPVPLSTRTKVPGLGGMPLRPLLAPYSHCSRYGFPLTCAVFAPDRFGSVCCFFLSAPLPYAPGVPFFLSCLSQCVLIVLIFVTFTHPPLVFVLLLSIFPLLGFPPIVLFSSRRGPSSRKVLDLAALFPGSAGVCFSGYTRWLRGWGYPCFSFFVAAMPPVMNFTLRLRFRSPFFFRLDFSPSRLFLIKDSVLPTRCCSRLPDRIFAEGDFSPSRIKTHSAASP